MPAQKNLFSLDDRVAIITGASRGIGAAIAEGYAAAGAKVVLAARKADAVEETAARIRASGGEALALAAHVGKLQNLQNLVETAVQRFGRVDLLVNNAATNVHFGPMLDVDDGAYAKTFEVNLKGSFELSRLVARHLTERGARGSIVNVSSVLGSSAAPLQGVYGMTKAAVISMTRTLAVELGSLGIRINAIAPGLVRTRLSEALHNNEEIVARVIDRTPLGRLADPEDLVGAALFLASDASAFITGQVIVVDGGLTLGVF